MEPTDEFLKLSRQERVESLRGTPWIRSRWLYLVLLAVALTVVTIGLLLMAAIKDDSTLVGLAVLTCPAAAFLAWASWGTRKLARR